MSNQTTDTGDPQSSAIDPMLALPSELFSQLLSFLPPQGIAASSAICRQWRASITSNPFLHRDIDLTGMGLGSEMEDVIRHFSRLSSLALHQVVKVSVDLSSFWEDFERIPIEEKDWERTGFESITSTSPRFQKNAQRDLFQDRCRDGQRFLTFTHIICQPVSLFYQIEKSQDRGSSCAELGGWRGTGGVKEI